MGYQEDPRLTEAKAIPMKDLAGRLGIAGLRPIAGELIGPCPLCGGRDRFGINLRSNMFLCRKCDLRGGDQIALVMGVLNLGFKEALRWTCGDKPAQLDQAEIQRRRARAADADRKQKAAQDRFRRKAISDARAIWGGARPGHLGVVPAYLRARGIDPSRLPAGVPEVLRFTLNHGYVKRIDGETITMHSGPCMIAEIRGPGGAVMAVHQTWIDPDPPHGKAKICFWGEAQPVKLVRGSKKGGVICLHTPDDADTLVMGEGIETTLSAAMVQPYRNAAYWAGVDLGNMSGRMQRGKGLKYAGLPDMSDREAFVPPKWVRRLVFIMDGDSEPRMTRAKLESGLRRAMALRPGLKGQIVQAGDGVDLNDVLVKA